MQSMMTANLLHSRFHVPSDDADTRAEHITVMIISMISSASVYI